MKCSESGRDREVRARGLCVTHYQRLSRAGGGPIRRRTPDLMERIRRYITGRGSCWEWTGLKNVRGYGRINVAGTMQLAHRATYSALRGPIPEGLELDHLCRNPSCVNPDHLEPVTHAENVRRWAVTLPKSTA